MLAVIGLLLPVVPASPFLIVASYLLVSVSPRLHNRLRQTWLVGPIIQDWETRRAIDVRIKAWTLVTVMVSISTTLTLVPLPLLVRTGVALLAAVFVLIVWRIPAVRHSHSERRRDHQAPDNH